MNRSSACTFCRTKPNVRGSVNQLW